METPIINGIYEHYKTGRLYTVLYIAKHSETLENMVVYKALYGNRDIWVRPLKMFIEILPNGKRFEYRGSMYDR